MSADPTLRGDPAYTDKPVRADNVPTSRPRTPYAHDQVKARAEQLWRERGRPAGQDDAIWLEAESQLLAEAESAPVSGTPSRPYVDEPGQPLRPRTRVQDPTEADVQTRSATEEKGQGPETRDQGAKGGSTRDNGR